MRILVTGASGFLGSAVCAAASARGHEVVASGRQPAAGAPVAGAPGAATGTTSSAASPAWRAWLEADLVAPGAAAGLVELAGVAGVIHCAALADIAPCRTMPALARRVNAEAAGELAAACARHGVALVHVSTDQVFDGSRGGWTEADAARPLHDYGATKLVGERAVAAAHPGAALVRPGLITGLAPPGRRSASTSLHAALARGDAPRMFTDELRSPVASVDVARALLDLLERLAAGAGSGAGASASAGAAAAEAAGLFHCGGPEPLTRHALALREARAAGLPADRILAATRDEAGLADERPADLSLDSARLVALLGWTPRTLADA